MELESAIQHLKESLADPTHKWGCEECKQEHEQLLKWLEDYKELKTDYIELNTENNELKRLLRLAVEDFQNVEEVCVGVSRCGLCPANNNCKWKHRDEAMELLGGTENAEN